MRALVLAAAVATAGCGPPLLKLPTGVGTPIEIARASAALTQATDACRLVRTLTAEVAVSGSAGGQRVRGRLAVGAAAPASVRLEAIAPFGAPLFFFVATDDDATLLLSRDDRVLEHGQPAAVLQAVAGVPLGAADLEAVLTGCIPAGPVAMATQFGDEWLALSRANGEMLYLRRNMASAPWRLVAAVRRATVDNVRWRADYGDWDHDVPRAIRLASIEDDGRVGGGFDLRLTLSQIDVNTPLGPEVFVVQIPQTARPITLGELRESGPLNGR
jgi:hypothetical protein